MTNTIIICHVLTPPAKYEEFIVGSQPMRMREYTAMNNNTSYVLVRQPVRMLENHYSSKKYTNYSACRRRGGVLNSLRFWFFYFYFLSVSEVGAALMGDTAGTSHVSRPKHGV